MRAGNDNDKDKLLYKDKKMPHFHGCRRGAWWYKIGRQFSVTQDMAQVLVGGTRRGQRQIGSVEGLEVTEDDMEVKVL